MNDTISAEALRRAMAKREREENIRICIDAMICPYCSGELSTVDWGNGYDIVCAHCYEGQTEAVMTGIFFFKKLIQRKKVRVLDTVC